MDSETAKGLLDEARSFFSTVERAFDFFGFDTAADNLRRYRSGQGGTHTYPDAEIERHPAVLEAEDQNRTYFENRTFTGQTSVEKLNSGLLDLEEGGTFTFKDHWNRATGLSGPATYLAFGVGE
jgi:hypothetical protein